MGRETNWRRCHRWAPLLTIAGATAVGSRRKSPIENESKRGDREPSAFDRKDWRRKIETRRCGLHRDEKKS